MSQLSFNLFKLAVKFIYMVSIFPNLDGSNAFFPISTGP